MADIWKEDIVQLLFKSKRTLNDTMLFLSFNLICYASQLVDLAKLYG